jgi:hypothetical protein
MNSSPLGSGGGVLNAGVWSLWGTPDPNPTGARALWDDKGAYFENQTYGIRVGADQTVVVTNQRSGDTYMAFAPAVGNAQAPCVAGCDSVTLVLEDGTKLTLQTLVTSTDDDGTPASSQRNVIISSQDFGLQVSGLGSDAGFRCVQTVAYGWLLDGAVADGHVLQENPAGAGLWGHDPQSVWQVVGQDTINAKELAALAKLSPWLSDSMQALVSLQCLLSITMVGTHRTLLGMAAEERQKPGPKDAQRRLHAPEGQEMSACCQLQRQPSAGGEQFLLRQSRNMSHPRAHPSSGRHGLA